MMHTDLRFSFRISHGNICHAYTSEWGEAEGSLSCLQVLCLVPRRHPFRRARLSMSNVGQQLFSGILEPL